MPVEQVPGFWDYLGQGVQQGVQNSQKEAQSNATLMGELFKAGAVDEALTSSLKRAGNPNPNVIESKDSKKPKALDTPGAVDALSDEEKRYYGFQTGAEKKVDTAAGAEADFKTARANAMTKFATGQGDLTDKESEITGFKTKGDRELDRLGKLDPYLDQVGERFVAGAINKNGTGIIAPGQAQATSEKAYADYVANRAEQGLGSLTPQEIQYTKSFFDRATQNAIIAQTKLDIARLDAQNRGTGAQANQTVNWFKAISSAEDVLRKKQDDLLRANPALAVALQNPQFAQNPMIKGALDEYQKAGEQMEAYRQAKATLGDGRIPPNMDQLLASSQANVRPVVQGGQPAGASTAVDPISTAAQRIIQGQAKESDLDALVKQGRMTQGMKDRIMHAVGSMKQARPTAPPAGGTAP